MYENQAPAMPRSREFNTTECITAWLCLLAGYFFCRVFPVSTNLLGGAIFILLLFSVTTVILKIKGQQLGVLPVVAAASAIILSISIFLNGNPFLSTISYIYSLVIYFYFIYSAGGNRIKKGFNNLIFADFFKALFVMPFASIHHLFRAMFSGKKSKKFVLKTLLGIAFAIIPTAVVLSLLSYDSSFNELWGKIFNISFENIFSHFLSINLGIPIGMYIFGSFVSSSDNKCENVLSEQSCKKVSSKIKIAPSLTVLVASVPLLFVYVVFFISQWDYYVSGFTKVLPANFSFAEYAREGFFQLCTVSVINLAIIIAAVLFMRRKAEKPPVVLKLLTVIYSLFTLILTATAISKMIMYIDFYGLTQKRVYATWFMVLLTVVFLIIVFGQFIKRLNVAALSLAACVLFFSVLALSGVDGFIAKYNVNRYIDGSLQTVDVDALQDLGDPAVPQMVRLAQHTKAKIAAETDTETDYEIYQNLWYKLNYVEYRIEKDNGNVFSLSLPSIEAKQAMERW